MHELRYINYNGVNMFEIKKGPIFIHMDLTGACNLRCIHCRATSKPAQNELKIEEIISFLDKCKKQFPNWENLFIGGGEPLLRKRDLFKLLEYAHTKLKIKCFLNTNATLLTKDDVKKIKKYVEIVQISLDGISPKTHDKIRRVKGAFDKAMKGLDLLLDEGIRVYLRMTISNINYSEAFELIDLGIKKNVEAVSFYRVLPVGNARKYNVYVDKKVYHTVLKELMRRKYELKDKIKIVSSDPIKVSMDPKMKKEILQKYNIKKSMGGCLPGITEIFINNVGNVYPCTMQPVLLGNIRSANIQRVWNHKHLLKLRDRNNLKGSCRTCSIKNVCGGCRAAAFGEYGDYFEEDPYCPNSFNREKRKISKTEGFKGVSAQCQIC